MPSSLADSNFVYSPNKLVLIIIIFTVLIILFVFKTLFGSYSIPHIISSHKKNRKINENYHSKFATRENLLFHISWAKSRGDMAEAKLMIRDLIELDKVY